ANSGERVDRADLQAICPAELAIDGRQVASLDQGDVVSFEADSCSAHFVRYTQQPKFHQIVRAKFGLGDD
ncbi:MAG: hypothetical protein ACKOGL_00280, partial [Acidimicrobiaceae bacterium]